MTKGNVSVLNQISQRVFGLLFAASIAFYSTGCSNNETSNGPIQPLGDCAISNEPRMGFTFMPGVLWAGLTNSQFGGPDLTLPFGNAFVERADLVSLHFGDSVPWSVFHQCGSDIENCTSLSGNLEAARLAFINLQNVFLTALGDSTFQGRDGRTYVAINPINGNRDDLAASYELQSGVAGISASDLTLNPEGNLTFGDATVRQAYKDYATYMLGKFNPTYFSQGIEVNMYLTEKPGDFNNLKSLLAEIYNSAIASRPCLKVGPTIQWEFYLADYTPSGNQAGLNEFAANMNLYGNTHFFSTYPHFEELLASLVSGSQPNLQPIQASHYNFNDFGFSLNSSSDFFISEAGVGHQFQPGLLDIFFDFRNQYQFRGLIFFFLLDFDLFLTQSAAQQSGETGISAVSLFFNNGLFDDASGSLVPHEGTTRWDQLFNSK